MKKQRATDNDLNRMILCLQSIILKKYASDFYSFQKRFQTASQLEAQSTKKNRKLPIFLLMILQEEDFFI